MSRGRISVWCAARWAGVGISCLALAIWVFSGSMSWWSEYETIGAKKHRDMLTLSTGTIVWIHFPVAMSNPEEPAVYFREPALDERPVFSRFGLVVPSLRHLKGPYSDQGWRIVVPLWLAFVASAGAAGVLWRFASGRRPPGRCRRCGYDLKGNVSGVCSECGEEIVESAATMVHSVRP